MGIFLSCKKMTFRNQCVTGPIPVTLFFTPDTGAAASLPAKRLQPEAYIWPYRPKKK